jgi:hypothetical protein
VDPIPVVQGPSTLSLVSTDAGEICHLVAPARGATNTRRRKSRSGTSNLCMARYLARW